MKEKDGNLKAGDMVMIRKDLEKKIYGTDGVVSEMLKNAGKIVTVSKVYQKIGKFSIEEDTWLYTPEMVEQNKKSETTTITIYNTPGSPKVSAVMRRGDTVIKSAKAMYNPNDALEGKPFSLDDGMELAVKRLFGWEEKAKPISLVKEVKRIAKELEWIKITEDHEDDRFKKDEMYKVMREDNGALYVEHPQGYECGTGFACILNSKYVVLENYHPETQVKFRKAKVGDRIKIVNLCKGGYHVPLVKIGDIFVVDKVEDLFAPGVRATNRNVFYDKDEEYIILNR